MSEIDLRGAMLDHCQLRYTDLSGADLRNASLTSCSLHAVNLTGARLDDAHFERCILTEATLDKAILTNSRWLLCELLRISGPIPAARYLSSSCLPYSRALCFSLQRLPVSHSVWAGWD